MHTPWSRMRFWSLIVVIACGILIAGTYLSATAYEGRFKSSPEFWMLCFAGTVAAVGAIGAHVRDHILVGQRALMRAIEDMPLHIMDYGDRREVAGHKLAMGVAKVQRRGLNPVE